ncbi:hypothetical protein JYU06_04210 [Desulfotalea psychrophila]|uniref:Uncharacterized protein n=1 Tax=Desulfotalea psychrophila TaxID=84980 RepID=A0ABS3AUQ9_9BACT|nr:hypothetical protein [Desulfotalea psychrophila]
MMELLIVISLAAFIVSLVTPRAMFMYDRLSARLEQLQWKGLADRTSYEAFIRQKTCVLTIMDELDNSGETITLKCGNNTVYESELNEKSINMEFYEFLKDEPLTYNAKGIRISTVYKYGHAEEPGEQL